MYLAGGAFLGYLGLFAFRYQAENLKCIFKFDRQPPIGEETFWSAGHI